MFTFANRFYGFFMSLKRTYEALGDAIVITMISFAISVFFVTDIFGFFRFDSEEEDTNVLISDIYYRVADNRSVKELNSDIVLIGVDNCNRGDMAALIDAVDYSAPRVIGLDVLFAIPGDMNDELLISAIDNCDNIVLPIRVQYDSKNDTFSSPIGSFFYNELHNTHYGVVNFLSSKLTSVRNFKPFFEVGKDSIDSFAASICKLYSPKDYDILKKRGNPIERINYATSEYMEYDAFEIIDNNGMPYPGIEEILCDKIVLIGGLDSDDDKHITPIESYMPGIKIHAEIIDTILSDKYISESNIIVEIFLPFLFCVLFLYVYLKSEYSNNVNKNTLKIRQLVLRIAQFLLIYVSVVVGCRLFLKHYYLVNFSYALLMFANTALIMEFYHGCKAVFKKRYLYYRLYKRIIKRILLHKL